MPLSALEVRGVSTPRIVVPISPFPLLRERRERPTLQRELGRRVLIAAFRETSIQRVTPAAHCVCKGKKRKGGVKNKNGKTSLNKHRDRTATARGPEMSRGPGSSTKDGTRPLRVPSHPGLSAPSAAVGSPPSRPSRWSPGPRIGRCSAAARLLPAR